MQMRETLILNFGPPTLSRLYCETCKEDTLHVRGACNHCTPQPNSSRTALRRGIPGRAAKAESPWRADHDAMCKMLMKSLNREL